MACGTRQVCSSMHSFGVSSICSRFSVMKFDTRDGVDKDKLPLPEVKNTHTVCNQLRKRQREHLVTKKESKSSAPYKKLNAN